MNKDTQAFLWLVLAGLLFLAMISTGCLAARVPELFALPAACLYGFICVAERVEKLL